SETLEISGTVKIVDGSQGEGKVLVSDANGKASWQTISTDIADGSITTEKISDASITTEKIADNAITYTQIEAGTITADRIAGSNSSALSNGTSGQSLSSNGDGTFSWIESTPFTNLPATGGAIYCYSIGANGGYSGSGPGEFKYPYFLTMNSSGTLYVADTYNHRIQVFTADGQYIKSIGSSGTNAGEFDEPYGIAVDDSKIYVADCGNHRVQVLNADSGVFEYSIGTGTAGSNPGQFEWPTGIAVDNNGKIYVADYSNHRVQVFSASGSFDYSIGTGIAGSNPGEFNYPYDVHIDSLRKIYVTDHYNSRVQIFSASGEYEDSFGSSGNGPGQFGRPTGITVDSTGKIYVSDFDPHRIQVFTSSYAYEYSIGTINSSSEPGKFEEPVGMFVNESGKLFVADSYNHRIQIFQVPGIDFVIEIGNIGFGTTSPTEKLEVAGSVKIVDGNQSDGKLFISDDDGKGSWQTIDAIPNNTIQVTKIAGSSNESQFLVSDDSGNSSWQYVKNEQNVFTVASNETITAGDIVQFNNGTISKGVGGYNTTPTVGSLFDFHSGTADLVCGAQINETTFVSVFKDRDTETGRAIIGQIDGISISWGDQYTFSATDVDNIDVCPAGENTFIIMYEDYGLGRDGASIVGTVSGTVITFGDKIIANAGNTYEIELSQLDDNKIVAQYRDDGNSGYETALIGEVNGYSISWGASDYPLGDAKYVAANALESLDDSKILCIYNYGGGGRAVIGDVSGTAISFGDEYTFQTGSIIYPSVAKITDNKIIIAYQMNFSPFSDVLIVGQVSGNTISYGLPYTFNDGGTSTISIACQPDGRFIVSYKNSISQGIYVSGKVTGTDIVMYEDVVFGSSPYKADTFWITDYKLVTTCGLGGFAVVGEVDSKFSLGIATSSGNAGELVNVTFSGVAENLSGLTTENKYYADENGNLTTTHTERYLGFAISDTELNLQTNSPGTVFVEHGLIHASEIAATENTALTNGNIGQVLSSNGDGTFSWADGSSGDSLIIDGSITASNLATSNGASLTSGTSGKSLVSNADGTFSWEYGSPLVHEDSNEFLYLSTIRHEPYFAFNSEEQNYLTTDQDGNIAYSFDNKLVTFSNSGEFVSEFGEGNGTGNYQFDDNWSAAFDSNGKIYVADYYNHRVMVYTSDKVFDFQIGTGSTGTGNGEFNKPVDVAVNSSGTIYVVDQLNHRVQRFSSTGEYYNEIGTGVSGDSNGQFNNPTSIALDSDESNQKFYVADSGNHRVQVFSMWGYESSFTLNNQDSGKTLYQLAFDSNGKIYVAYAGSDCGVQVYDNSGTYLYNIGTDASPSGVIGYLKYAKGVTIDNDDNIYISETNGSIHKFSNDGTPIFRLASSGFAPGDLSGPSAVDIDSNGNIFILEKSNARISVFTSSEAFSYSIYYTGSSNDQGVLNYPDDLDVSSGKIYVADTFNSRIQVFNSSSGAYDYSIDCGGMPKGIKVDDSSGKIYASIEASDIIKVYSNSGNFEYTIGSGNSDDAPGSIDGPQSMDIDSDGNIYVAESNNKRVSVFSSAGIFQYSITYNFDYPIDVAVDNDKNIYVLDNSNGNIKAFSSDREFQYMYGSSGNVDGSIAGNNLFSYPSSLTVDNNGKIYVADKGNQRVQIYSSSISSYYVNDARIGIGTSTPDETLEVVGSVKIVDGNQ
ncbi:hypothetical protein MHK_003572, partial [Candidatus Magnetomorum sp. HK-1]